MCRAYLRANRTPLTTHGWKVVMATRRTPRCHTSCPFWVRSRHMQCKKALSAFPPCVDGSGLASQNFTSRCWSVQPCVRPVSAVRMTAGHNALRGSGPGQKPAFCDALAHVGRPDRRIDRLCITCCSPSQPSHRAGHPARPRSRRKGDRFLVALALGHHGPSHSGDLVGERDGGDLGRPPSQ